MARDRRRNDLRSRIANLAARMMAEEGIGDYAHAKRKAAREAGLADPRQLPSNEEIDEALKVHQALYQQTEHGVRQRVLREHALRAMREFAQFNPHLTGSVLNGNAGRYAEIELQLFTDSAKIVEMFLLDSRIPYRAAESRFYSGEHPLAAPVFTIRDDGVDIQMTVLPEAALRVPLKSSLAGKPIERAKLRTVEQLLGEDG